jgi:hypothetical protein
MKERRSTYLGIQIVNNPSILTPISTITDSPPRSSSTIQIPYPNTYPNSNPYRTSSAATPTT